MLFRVSGFAVLGVLIAATLTWLPVQAFAADQDPAQEEFVAFLEYLGSWDGNEEDWVQFLDGADSALREEGMPAAAEATPASAAREEDPDLRLATTGN